MQDSYNMMYYVQKCLGAITRQNCTDEFTGGETDNSGDYMYVAVS